MKSPLSSCLALLLGAISFPAMADSAVGVTRTIGDSGRELPPYLQCVPYARQVSGIQIYGDAHTWWGQAAGRYQRGSKPRVGAVMAFEPHGNMELGHVAAVSRIVDSRTVLLRHANWSLIDGRRGQIEDNVRAVDVSENNDWSAVRVWYAPIQALGGTAWPVEGFIYREKAKAGTGSKAAFANKADTATKAKAQLAGAGKRADPIGAIIARAMD